MARTQTMVQLTGEIIDELDSEADRRGVSRSALIREALQTYLSDLRSRDVGSRIVAGYRAHPPQTPDPWGDQDRFGDTATLELTQRLAQEERSEGHEPW